MAVVIGGLAIAIAGSGHAAAQAAGRTEVDEPWFFTLDALVSGPINDLPREQFDVGGGGALGLYRSFLPELAFGFRVGGGALTPGRAIPQDPVDRGALGMAQLDLSMRVRPLARLTDLDRRASGLWLQAGGGPWIVEDHVVPAFDAGIGYGIGIGEFVVSPMVQVTDIVETEDRFGVDHVVIWNAGLELAFHDVARTRIEGEIGKPESERVRVRERGVPPTPAAARTPGPAAAPPAREEWMQPFVNDRLVIDERVFFDYDRWELRPAGREQLDEVARRYREDGQSWQALVVSGHADRRGPEDYNVELSRKRAEAVRRYLTERGVPADVLEIQAWGETRPEIPDAETEYEHQVNRRVQFEIVWRPGMRPEGEAPSRPPPEPDRVDPAPPARRDLP